MAIATLVASTQAGLLPALPAPAISTAGIALGPAYAAPAYAAPAYAAPAYAAPAYAAPALIKAPLAAPVIKAAPAVDYVVSFKCQNVIL